MTKQRVVERFCNLKSMNVNILEKGTEELGRDGVIEWQADKCLNKAEDCDNLNCEFVVRGMGDCGKQNPFE